MIAYPNNESRRFEYDANSGVFRGRPSQHIRDVQFPFPVPFPVIFVEESDYDSDDSIVMDVVGPENEGGDEGTAEYNNIERPTTSSSNREDSLPVRRSPRPFQLPQRFAEDRSYYLTRPTFQCANAPVVPCKKYGSRGLSLVLENGCGICLSQVARKDAYVSSCNHIFCVDCFDHWNRNCFNCPRKEVSCPTCRSKSFTLTKFQPRRSK
jgi:hypothetical protein